MATHDERIRTTITREFALSAPAAWGDVQKAAACAAAKYREVHGLPVDEALSDNCLMVRDGDGEVVIYFERDEVTA